MDLIVLVLVLAAVGYNVARRKKFWTDRIALVTSGIGMALMILTVVWRINPVEGSVAVVPHFLEGNPFGEALVLVTDRYVHARVDPHRLLRRYTRLVRWVSGV